MKISIKISSLLLLALQLASLSRTLAAKENLYFCEDPRLPGLALQAAGRVKPLIVHAKETIQFALMNKPKHLTDTALFCLLTLEAFQLPNDVTKALEIKIEHPKVKELLGVDSQRKGEFLLALLEKQSEIQRAYNQRQEEDGEKKELQKVLSRLEAIQQIRQGLSWTVPHLPAPSEDGVTSEWEWRPIVEQLTPEQLQAEEGQWKQYLKEGQQSKESLVAFLTNRSEQYQQQQSNTVVLEHWYLKISPYRWSLVCSLLGLFLLFLLPGTGWALGLIYSTLLLQLTAMVLRVLISGRAPITNMYETVLFSGFGALIFALIIFHWRKEKIYLLAGLGHNFLSLMMINFANNMLSPSIAPLVPVLRDNFWLSTHVTCIILSYSALALSWMLANLSLINRIVSLKALAHYREEAMGPLIYRAIKIGIVLLSTGIILGGIWADYSWGRFWGWDPKETWSLIVLLIYMAIAHGKYTQWISKKNFIPLVAAAFMSVMMAWFGVNYILATGLHSYGFSEGGAIFLGSFFLLQILLLIFSSTILGQRLRHRSHGS